MRQRKLLMTALGLLVSLQVCAQGAAERDTWAWERAAPELERGNPAGELWESAQLELERNHWREAYDGFARLADRGDVKAARMAYQMWLYAPMLYGQVFPVRVDQVQRWGALCECTPVKRAQKQSEISTAAVVTP